MPYQSLARLESRRGRPLRARVAWALLIVGILAGIVAAAAWYLAGDAPGPRITIMSPGRAMGGTGELDVLIETPEAALVRLDAVVEQNSRTATVFELNGERLSALTVAGENRLRLLLPIGKNVLPQLQDGKARVSVRAARPVLFGYRRAESTASREFDVRLTPPHIAPLSRFHHISPGGSEAIVYEVSGTTAASGVRVGGRQYPGFPASQAGISHADVGLRVAFFALPWDEGAATAILLFARDDVGNEARTSFEVKVLPRSPRKGRIELDDRFLNKVVPPILERSPDLRVDRASDVLNAFLRINGELRKQNSATIAQFALETAGEILWRGPFRQLANSAVEGTFADQRTYLYKGQEVDRQVHLGYDLASTASAEVLAANRGKVVHAGWLGIYGNCVVLDHGMGVQSLYAHLSSIGVATGSMVEGGAVLGRTGSTGLAGGDHLHFTMLVGGTPVTPLEWWSPKWVQDRVLRKLREAEALGTGQRGSASMAR